MKLSLTLLLLFAFQPGHGPLAPKWSPDHKILATTRSPERFVTPEGPNYALLLNGRIVYPKPNESRFFSAYANQHTFLTELAWSPDSQRLAFLEKVYDWEYSDPYNRDFDGSVSKKRYYLVIVSRNGNATGYRIDQVPANPEIDWCGDFKVALNGRIFDIRADPPKAIN